MTDRRTFVLDTSVLLADPHAIDRFDEHHVVVPVVVITELEQKRTHPELGWAAREALRRLEQIRVEFGELHTANRNGKGTVRVEMNNVGTANLPEALRTDSADTRVLAVARNLGTRDDCDVVLVTKDLPLRLRAALADVTAEEYQYDQVTQQWTGMIEVTDPSLMDELQDNGDAPADSIPDPVANCGVIVRGDGRSRSTIGRIVFAGPQDKAPTVQRLANRQLFGLRPKSAPQRVAVDLLTDPTVGIVSIGGKAGTGKSVLALAAGLDAVLERETHRRVLVFRPIQPVGGQDLGYLPGSEAEKMGPWAGAVDDALEAICGPEVRAEVQRRGLLEVLPLTHIRGRTLTDSFVVIDEAQNLERMVLVTALTRIGSGSRVVLTHDVDQRDNPHVGPNDGVAAVIAALKGSHLFGHVTLTKTERSPVAALVANAFGG